MRILTEDVSIEFIGFISDFNLYFRIVEKS